MFEPKTKVLCTRTAKRFTIEQDIGEGEYLARDDEGKRSVIDAGGLVAEGGAADDPAPVATDADDVTNPADGPPSDQDDDSGAGGCGGDQNPEAAGDRDPDGAGASNPAGTP